MRIALLALACAAIAGVTAAPAVARPARTVTLQVLGVNDLHGNLEPPLETHARPAGGAAYLAAHLRRARAGNPRGTLLLHSGDMVGGSPLISSWFHDEPTIDAIDLMGFDAGTIGNHELDHGEGEMLHLIRRADFPYLSANVLSRATGRPLLRPYRIFTRRGVRVGVIGVTTLQTVSIVAPSAIAGLRFTDLSSAVNRSVAALQRRGVHTIVVLAHAGGAELAHEAAQMSPDVDLILGGHTHQRTDTHVGRRIVLQAGRYGEAFDDVRLTVRRRDDQVVAARPRLRDAFDGQVRPDPAVAKLVSRYRARIAPIGERVVATAAAPATRRTTAEGESPLGDLVADGERRLAGAEVALVNSGAIRADLPAGPVTYADAFAAQPWGDDVVAVTLSGADLRAALGQQFTTPDKELLQVSGMSWQRSGPVVTAITVAGAPLEDARDYRVAINGALSTGADGYTALARGRDQARVGTDVEALVGELGALPQPYAPADPRAAPRVVGSA